MAAIKAETLRRFDVVAVRGVGTDPRLPAQGRAASPKALTIVATWSRVPMGA
jgi:hypothetical protein